MKLHDIAPTIPPDDQILLDFLMLRFPILNFQFDGQNFTYTIDHDQITWPPGDPTRNYWLLSARTWDSHGRPTDQITNY